MTQDNATTDTLLKDFEVWLKKLDRSAHSIRAYLSDVRQFSIRFSKHANEPFNPAAVTGDDVIA